MAQKPNKSGQMKEYVPSGNGDASGEYADNGGSNKHFTAFGKPQNPEAINGNQHGNPVGEKPQEKQETPEETETQQFDNNDDVNKLIEKTPEERKESLSKRIKEKFEGNEETLDEMVEKVLEQTSEEGISFLDDYLEKNNSLKVMEEFEKLRKKYIKTFDEEPPIVEMLDYTSDIYLNALEEAIQDNNKLTRDDIAKLVYTDNKITY